jgi:HPt (histidine-containing phosphotransfer) domain-containing protein
MAPNTAVIAGPDAAMWSDRLRAVPELQTWVFIPGDDVSSASLGIEPDRVDLLLLTEPLPGAAGQFAAWVGKTPPARQAVTAVLTESGAVPFGTLALPASSWSQWAPSLHMRVETERVRLALAEFADLGGPDFPGEMTDLLLQQTPKQFAAIDVALAAGDLVTCQRHAHSMKSTFGNFGARRCQRLATEMDLAAREGRADDCRRAFGDLKRVFDTLRGLLSAT